VPFLFWYGRSQYQSSWKRKHRKYIDEQEVARVTGRALSTLRNERFNRRGIPYYKVGRSVRYSLQDGDQLHGSSQGPDGRRSPMGKSGPRKKRRESHGNSNTANQERAVMPDKKKETKIILKPLISLCHSIELCTSIIVKQKNLTINLSERSNNNERKFS